MKFLHIKKQLKGFTLVELIIYMGLFSILLTVVTTLFTFVIDLQIETEANTSIEEDGKYIINRMKYDIEHATTITTPATRSTQTSTLQTTINGVPYLYSLNGSNNIQLGINGTTYQLNGYNTTVTDLSFRRIGNATGHDTVQITFTLHSRVLKSGVPEVKTIQTTVGLRPN